MKKNNWTKRGLAALVALGMCFGMLNVSAFAAGCNHENRIETVEQEPTCTEKGNSTIRCLDCGSEVDHNSAEPLGHDYGDCTLLDAKQHGYTCSRCGDVISGDHSLSARITEATCTEKGNIEYYCTVCGAVVNNEEIPAKGHITKIVVDNEPTCTVKGNEHEVCTVCEAVVENKEIPALGHDYGAWSPFDTKQHSHKCTRCSDEVIEDHTLSMKTTDATCTEKGNTEYYCTVCNAVVNNEEIPAKGHFTKIVVDNEPTCTEKGNEHEVCTVCGAVVENKEIPALGHELEPILQSATCTAPGLTGVKCTRPGCDYRDEIPADAIGHDYKIIEQIEGDSVKHLLICGNDASHTMTAPHAFGEWVTVREATATVDGERRHECAGCGYTETQPIPATGASDDDDDDPTPVTPIIPGDDDDDDTPTTPVTPIIPGDDDDDDDDTPTTPVTPVIPGDDDDDDIPTIPAPSVTPGDDDDDDDTPVVTIPDTDVPMAETPAGDDDVRMPDTPEVTVPDADVPLAGVPEVTVPDGDVPLAGAPEVTVPDGDVPLADAPEAEIPDADVPLADIPDTDVPLAGMPMEIDIPDENVPLADVPKTGDNTQIWMLFALASGVGLAWLALNELKRKADAE